MKLSFFIFLLFSIACVSEHSTATPTSPQQAIQGSTVSFGGKTFLVELADTLEQRRRGLMFRTELAKDKGMLFSYDQESLHSIWMKNTKIPLDVVWISKDLRIVDKQTLYPCTSEPCPIFRPAQQAQFILEIAKDAYSGTIGEQVTIQR